MVKPTYSSVVRDSDADGLVRHSGGGSFPSTKCESSVSLFVTPDMGHNNESPSAEIRKRRRIASSNVTVLSIHVGPHKGRRDSGKVWDSRSIDPAADRKEYNKWSRLSSGRSHVSDDPGGSGGMLAPITTDLVARVSKSGVSRTSGNVSSGPPESAKDNAYFACLNKLNNAMAKILLDSLKNNQNFDIKATEGEKYVHMQAHDLLVILNHYCKRNP